jgi:hypothetical protein
VPSINIHFPRQSIATKCATYTRQRTTCVSKQLCIPAITNHANPRRTGEVKLFVASVYCSMSAPGPDEHAVAVAVAALLNATAVGSVKRSRDDADADHAAGGSNKAARVDAPDEANAAPAEGPAADVSLGELKPYPYFYYQDFSTHVDPDPLTPLTAPGRVPNFPAKMHSILSRPELAEIVCWMPHGRSWRVLKPREFEVRVIPTYFEHAKFSSFIRQANGWGFRRITQGRDRNSYYHELFLRGLPHLCKEMKRPGVAQKIAGDPEHEPDLYRITELHPVPEKTDDESILLQCTLQGGPKARMPIYSGALATSLGIPPVYGSSATSAVVEADAKRAASPAPLEMITKPAAKVLPTPLSPSTGDVLRSNISVLSPTDQLALDSFQQALGASESQMKNLQFSPSGATNNNAVHNSTLTQHLTNIATARILGLPLNPGTYGTYAAAQNPYQVHHNHNHTLPMLSRANPLSQGLSLSQASVPTLQGFNGTNAADKLSALALANQLAFLHNQPARAQVTTYAQPPSTPTHNTANNGDLSSFAAGFAAATALQQQQLRNVLGALGAAHNAPR